MLAHGNTASSRELGNDGGKSSEGLSTPLDSEIEDLIGRYGAGDGKGKNLDEERREREPKGMVEVAKSEWNRTTKKSKRPGGEGQRVKNRAGVEKEIRNQEIGEWLEKTEENQDLGIKL